MYSTCLFCNADLGKNEVVEHFPVGRRLAFDAAKGRLWVVCRKCERWNLTPLEERWEAIEECERAFASTKRRVSTDNIGMARLPEGLELVRIGAPQRPEMAAWRYGDQFGRRRKRYMAMTAGGIAAAGAIVAIGPVAGLVSWGVLGQIPNVFNIANSVRASRTRIRIPLADGGSVTTNLMLIRTARLQVEGDRPRLDVKLAPPSGFMHFGGQFKPAATLLGEDAIRAAGLILPHVNRAGGREGQVREAVRLVESAPDVTRLFGDMARDAKRRFNDSVFAFGDPGDLRHMPAPMRLALEMATHEEQERRALEGELAELEAAWQQAEEIAKIADEMFVGDRVQSRLEGLRRRRDG